MPIDIFAICLTIIVFLGFIIVFAVLIMIKKYEKRLDVLICEGSWSECFSFYKKKQGYLTYHKYFDPMYDVLDCLNQIESSKNDNDWKNILGLVKRGLVDASDLDNNRHRRIVEKAFCEYVYIYGKQCMEEKRYIEAYDCFKTIASYKDSEYLKSKCFVVGHEQFLAVHRAVLIKAGDTLDGYVENQEG